MIARIKHYIVQPCPLWLQICIALISAMAMVGFATTRLGQETRELEIGDLLKAQSMRTLNIFSAGALEPVISEDIPALNTLISETIQTEQHLYSVDIYNPEDALLAAWKKPKSAVPINAYTFEHSIVFEGDLYGNIVTMWDPTRLEHDVSQRIAIERSRMLIALSALTALSLLLVYFFVTAPLSKIERRLRFLSDTDTTGDTGPPLTLSSSREIAVLSSAVNELEGAINASRMLAIELEYQASHDYLTGLDNRSSFEDIFKKRLESRHAESLDDMLLYIDLDQFKVINDTCGHAAGDALLIQLSNLLDKEFDDNDTFARIGGDEFAVLLVNRSLESGLDIAENMRNIVDVFRFTWQDRSFNTGASIGAIAITGVGTSIEELTSSADVACFAAKSAGRNRVHLFKHDDEELNERQSEMDWVPRIRSAIENSEFVLFGQVIETAVPTANSSHHLEVLIRMNDGDKLVPPGAFLPAAERYGIITSIDRWVISSTLDWMEEQFQNTGFAPTCAINISGFSFGDNQFREFVLQALSKTDIPGEHICFEITETAAVTNLSNAIEFMEVVKQFNCKFALDDFGTGMSSFTYLKELPVDFVKIDGSFVKDILVDETCVAMVRSLADISSVMKIQTIAEFVENDAIRTKLQQLGVDYVQGYGVGKPKPLIEFNADYNQMQPAA